MFFDLAPKGALLADANAELVDCYTAVRDCVDEVIEALRRHTYREEHYYAIRAQSPSELELPARAARTIFLNRSGFNGLYRVNRTGAFNVPFGRYTNPTLCDAPNLRACAEALHGVELKCCDFADAVRTARRGDFVYLDPPYIPVSETANFTRYAMGGFAMEQHARLAKVFETLSVRGVSAVLSNSNSATVRKLYRDYEIQAVSAARSINSDPAARGKVKELVVTNRKRNSRAEPEPARLPDPHCLPNARR